MRDEPPKNGPLGGADFAALLDTIRSAVAEVAAVPQLLDGVAARRYVGLKKSAWFRAKSAGLIPAPVYVQGAGDRYRRTDLDKFVSRLKPGRRKKT